VVIFALTEYPSAAVSEPEGFDSVTQLASDWAVHPHVPDARVTVTLNWPPSATADWDVADKV
jgi:hypothetical protein